jgi:hypothetical protein
MVVVEVFISRLRGVTRLGVEKPCFGGPGYGCGSLMEIDSFRCVSCFEGVVDNRMGSLERNKKIRG